MKEPSDASSHHYVGDIVPEIGPSGAASLPQDSQRLQLLTRRATGQMDQGSTHEQGVIFVPAAEYCPWHTAESHTPCWAFMGSNKATARKRAVNSWQDLHVILMQIELHPFKY